MENIFANKKSVWSVFKNTHKPIVLYGMGDGADKVLNIFDGLNINISAVMASDDFVRGQFFHNLKVKKLSEIQQEFGNDFIIALCFGSQLADVIDHIKVLSKNHSLYVPSVPVFGNNIFDEDFAKKHFPLIEKADELFADEKSKKCYKDILLFQYTGDIRYLFDCETDKNEAFNNILKLNNNEFYVDLGACKGDTIEEFMHYTTGYKKIVAFEPNGKNFEKLKDFASNINDAEIWNLASHSENSTLYFNNKSGRRSSEVTTGGVAVQGATVDSILFGRAASYIKIDVEGAEENTIIGAENTITLFKPKLNVAVYHRCEDIFKIPLLINSINPEYKIFLRHHPYIPCWDTNIYCI